VKPLRLHLCRFFDEDEFLHSSHLHAPSCKLGELFRIGTYTGCFVFSLLAGYFFFSWSLHRTERELPGSPAWDPKRAQVNLATKSDSRFKDVKITGNRQPPGPTYARWVIASLEATERSSLIAVISHASIGMCPLRGRGGALVGRRGGV